MSRVVIAGGGTGGHIYPGLAIAEGLIESGLQYSDITFIGSRFGMEGQIIPEAEFKIIQLPGRGLNKNELFKNVFNAGAIVVACLIVTIRFIFQRPKVVIGVGGYASLPAIFSAFILRIPRLVHEQNSVLGRTNKIASKLGSTVLTTFEETQGIQKAVRIGLPLRKNIDTALALRESFLKDPPSRPIITFSGGSLGANAINETIYQMLKKYEVEAQINHVTGKKHFDQVKSLYEGAQLTEKINLFDFRNDISELYAKSNLVISRAGAGTCVELDTLAVQCILVPLASAPGDHQRLNASELVKKGLGRLILSEELNADTLYEMILDFTSTYAAQQQSYEPNQYHIDARRRIAELVNDQYL